MLGRQPVVERQDGTAGAGRQATADRVVGVETTEHPAATMKVDEYGGRCLASLGHIAPRAQRPGGKGKVDIIDPGDRGRLAS